MLKIIDAKLKFRQALIERKETKYIVLHHAEAACCTVQDIHFWHLSNGWAGIGYQYFIRKDGSIYRGRPEWAVGSHCKGSNYCSIGICVEGNYDDSNRKIRCDRTMPAAQYNSLVALIKDIKARHKGIQIKGHGELLPTKCPGRFYPLAKLKNIK